MFIVPKGNLGVNHINLKLTIEYYFEPDYNNKCRESENKLKDLRW